MKREFLGKRSGFSLIEVLVATALLVIIVGMVGFVFRQSSMSWNSGIHSAEGSMMVRSVIGALERDLRSAVDAREFGLNQTFSGSDLEFIALVPPEQNKGDSEKEERAIMKVRYSGGTRVERKAWRLHANGDKSWTTSGSAETTTLLEPVGSDDPSYGKSSPSVSVSFSSSEGSSSTFPRYVTITAELTNKESFSGLEVRSTGPDRKANTKDDIVTK